MGIFTKDGRVAAPMYDKYRQINRFVELVDDALSALPDREDRPFTVLDFGCGKSYLTFVLYHYFTRVRGLPVRMVGLDLKQDVITRCNETARRYGYDGLRFELGDINGYDIDCPVDMVVTLHACDTATDHALFHAVRWEVPLVLSVPCCQHEVNGQIKAKELSLLTHYGIVKERFSALLTDARARQSSGLLRLQDAAPGVCGFCPHPQKPADSGGAGKGAADGARQGAAGGESLPGAVWRLAHAAAPAAGGRACQGAGGARAGRFLRPVCSLFKESSDIKEN